MHHEQLVVMSMNIAQEQCRGMARISVRVSALPRPTLVAHSGTTSETCVSRTVLKDFLASNHWAGDLQAVHASFHKQLESALGDLKRQPTAYSASGNLHVPSLNGDVDIDLQTHSGGPVSHKVQSTMLLVDSGLMHIRTIVHACLPQGTPFLDISLIGGSQSTVLAMFMLPRICPMRHTDYMLKYYKTVPATASSEILPLTRLVHQIRSKSDQVFSNQVYRQAGRIEAAPLLYKLFSSPNLWSRIMSGYGVMVEFQTQAPLMAMVQQDVAAMVNSWCAWVREDWAEGNGLALTGALAEECKDYSRIYANFLQYDEDGDKILQIFGDEGATQLLDTMSGKAAMTETPWWAT